MRAGKSALQSPVEEREAMSQHLSEKLHLLELLLIQGQVSERGQRAWRCAPSSLASSRARASSSVRAVRSSALRAAKRSPAAWMAASRLRRGSLAGELACAVHDT